ncbi:acetyl-CoA carboxylase biotin carboxylase subunit family protein [Streptomyces sp. NBC_00083]|uniref:ATP-grasp domain-containing protein n=1 Tax=Streptomyces sp. NBC_00083 TaxID=2975647 RepID=UPI002257D063|nr:ATP-grasp domain-containing protein [Streptomyces sp. NBC_00083]MCX5383349.1 ATP-grasp domain-containing protein [Streptomyces sp. NBC_00083]
MGQDQSRRVLPGTAATPLLLLVHDRGSAAPLRVLAAARGLCRVVLLCEPDDPELAAGLRMVAGHAEIVDITGLDDAAVCRLAAGLTPAGVVTFSERRLHLTASVAAACRLPFHRPDTVEALTDKFRQRQVLADSGVQHTRCALVRDPAGLAGALALVGLPAVLKPRSGAGSVDTCLVRSEGECRTRLAEFTEGHGPAGRRDFVLEEYLPGDPAPAGPGVGDYVSVESVLIDGAPRTVAVTGKPPLVPPFRETGHILPAPLAPALAADVVALEQRAVRALGVRHGVTHTEIKLTPHGPRIIEVNGRLGGHVAEIVQRALGYDLVAAALRCALGLPVAEPPGGTGGPEPGRPGRVAFQYMLVPPAGALGSVRPAALVEELAGLPGVDLVDVPGADGRPAHWRAGTAGALGVVYGSADDHTALRALLAQLRLTLADFWPKASAGSV